MSPTEKPKPRAGRAALTLTLVALAASVAMSAPPELGETVPGLSLPTLGGSEHVLSERDGPTVLVFFRGAW
jgi:hypothetical protein